MAGAVAIVVVLAVLFPVVVLMVGAAGAALLGSLLHRDGEARYTESELLDVNV